MTAELAIEAASPNHPEARALLDDAADVLRSITGRDGRDSFAGWIDDERHLFLIARFGEMAVGCAGVRPIQDGVGEIKRLFAARPWLGVGSALLRRLEAEARTIGYRELWCETRRVNEPAVRFYLAQGYAVRQNYGRYVGQETAVCFGQAL